MKRIVGGLAAILVSFTLWADVCPNGYFWAEKESLDPQVKMGVENIIMSSETDPDGNHVTKCTSTSQSVKSVYTVSYTTSGNIKEVRRLSLNDGLNEEGTVCTASGIYLFRVIAPQPYSDPSGCTYSSCPIYCRYSFVFHGESCAEQGVSIAVDSADYVEATRTNECYGTLEEVIELSKTAGYQDIGGNDADTSTDGDDITDTNSDSKKGGCALTIID